MATWDDVERIALALPETGPVTAWGRPAFGVNGKWFVLDRAPRKDAVDEDGELLTGLAVVYVQDEAAKFQLAADDSGYFLTTPHFTGSRMVLIRLAQIPTDELAEVMTESWLVRAPKRLAREYLEGLDR